MLTTKQMRAKSKKFASDNLAQCCAEILEWKTTATLCNGKVRELAASCALWIGEDDSLRVAEDIVSHLAMERVASSK